MMEYIRRSTQLLHEDHRETVALIGRLGDLIAQAGQAAPDMRDDFVRKTLKETSAAIKGEVRQHFAFEETEMFTRLDEAGETEMTAHLRDEHRIILPIGEELAGRADKALEQGFSAKTWGEFRSLTGDLTGRLLAHIQKEDMALLPMLDELLSPETDMQLSEAYASPQ